jgi:uncharacterized protein (TIGR03066 family)
MTSTTVAADKDDNAKALVGKWEAVKVAEGTLPKGAVVEFKKDGKFTTDAGDTKLEGTYTVDADSFTLVFKIGDAERKLKITIKKIGDTELDTANPDGKGVTFKRVK